MISLLDWYKEFLRIRREDASERQKPCETCEYLKIQLEKAQILNSELISKLTYKPVEQVATEAPQVIQPPRYIPWNVRRQALEAEDRRAAQVMAEKKKEMEQSARHVPTVSANKIDGVEVAPADDPDVIALEKEMDIVAKERENAGKVR